MSDHVEERTEEWSVRKRDRWRADHHASPEKDMKRAQRRDCITDTNDTKKKKERTRKEKRGGKGESRREKRRRETTASSSSMQEGRAMKRRQEMREEARPTASSVARCKDGGAPAERPREMR